MHVDRFIEPGPKKVTLGPAELGAEATRVSIRVVEPKSIDQSAPDTPVRLPVEQVVERAFCRG